MTVFRTFYSKLQHFHNDICCESANTYDFLNNCVRKRKRFTMKTANPYRTFHYVRSCKHFKNTTKLYTNTYDFMYVNVRNVSKLHLQLKQSFPNVRSSMQTFHNDNCKIHFMFETANISQDQMQIHTSFI